MQQVIQCRPPRDTTISCIILPLVLNILSLSGNGIAAVIDQEVKRIVDGCHQEARRIITEHLDELHACANLLIDKEKTREEFEAIFPEKTENEKLRFM